MAERAAAVGGSFSAAAGSDGGFVVVARLPAAGPGQPAAGQTRPGQATGAGDATAESAAGQDAAPGTAPATAADAAR
jgi:hypothetical protein